MTREPSLCLPIPQSAHFDAEWLKSLIKIADFFPHPGYFICRIFPSSATRCKNGREASSPFLMSSTYKFRSWQQIYNIQHTTEFRSSHSYKEHASKENLHDCTSQKLTLVDNFIYFHYSTLILKFKILESGLVVI